MQWQRGCHHVWEMLLSLLLAVQEQWLGPSMESIQAAMCSDREEFKLSPHSSQPLLFLAPFHVCLCVCVHVFNRYNL